MINNQTEAVELERDAGKGRRWVKWLWLLVAVLLALGVGGWLLRSGESHELRLITAPVTRGELLETISATGTVEPEEVVDVGAQVAGQILSFGKDAEGKTVDYGSIVKKGTVLARIDDELYAADEAKARAVLNAAQAGLHRAEADLGQLKAKLSQAERDWRRAQKLGPSEALSQASYDAYQSAFETAKANLAVGDAAVAQARAEVAQQKAALIRSKRALGYCTITSPVGGVIIDRRVNIGQTVVASLNAPSLFLIAKDLRRMQVWVAVNEADIGRIHPGQPVTFTVDAFPGETFTGKVGKVRLNATMTQNVVTYTVEIQTDNSSGRLLPYLSANVRFEVKRISNALLVPNSALRWRPPAGMAAGNAPAERNQEAKKGNRGQIWVPDGGSVRLVPVAVLGSDRNNTAVKSPKLSDGEMVVTGLQESSSENDGITSPFAPKFRGRSKSGKKP